MLREPSQQAQFQSDHGPDSQAQFPSFKSFFTQCSSEHPNEEGNIILIPRTLAVMLRNENLYCSSYIVAELERIEEDGKKPRLPPSGFYLFSGRRKREIRRAKPGYSSATIMNKINREWRRTNKTPYKEKAKQYQHEYKVLLQWWSATMEFHEILSDNALLNPSDPIEPSFVDDTNQVNIQNNGAEEVGLKSDENMDQDPSEQPLMPFEDSTKLDGGREFPSKPLEKALEDFQEKQKESQLLPDASKMMARPEKQESFEVKALLNKPPIQLLEAERENKSEAEIQFPDLRIPPCSLVLQASSEQVAQVVDAEEHAIIASVLFTK